MKNFFLNSELETLKREFKDVERLATALVKTDSTEATREVIVTECLKILKADALCLYILQPKGYYEMIAARNCTQEFQEQWYRLYPEHLPVLFQERPTDDETPPVFYGSASEFKKEFPTAEELVENSKRKTIAYAPLMVNQKSVGLLGFSYNSDQKPADKEFLSTIINLCAQALERARLLELERLARREAEAANRAKTDFLSTISHEIRTPINTIKGFAELMSRSHSLDYNQKDWVARILKNAEHLNQLVGDVVDVSKIEADKIEVHCQVFSLGEFIDEVRAITLFSAEEKNIDLVFLSSNSDIDIYSDTTLLRQIVVNLIGNAIKFTPRSGRVEVRFYFGESKLRVEVEDTGIGIAREDQTKIFEQFAQIEKGAKNTSRSGLGLFISKRLAIALGGDLTLKQSSPSRGSIFVAETACAKVEAIKGKPKLKALSRSKTLAGLKFLLVDDSVDNQILVKCVLAEQGAQVDTADNGKMGVEKALKADYEVIIMDIQMPELDGNEAVSKLRLGGYRKPIVALTAEVLTSQKQNSLQRGFDEYLPKPLNHELLIRTLGQLVNQV